MSSFNQEINNSEMPPAAVLFTSILCVLFGSNSIAMKLSLQGFGPFTVAGLRFGISSLLIFIWAIRTGKTVKLSKKEIPEIALLAAAFFVQLAGFHIGMNMTHASRATIIINAQPFMVLFLAHYFIPGDGITLRKFTGILFGFMGVVFVFLENSGRTPGLMTGDIIILFATSIWAGVIIFTKRIIHRYQPFQMIFYSMTLAFPIYLVMGYFLDKPMVSGAGFIPVAGIFFQGAATGAFGFVAWNTLLQKYGAVSLNTFVFLAPVAGVTLGGLVLGEPVTGKILISLTLIVCGILIVNYRREGEKGNRKAETSEH